MYHSDFSILKEYESFISRVKNCLGQKSGGEEAIDYAAHRCLEQGALKKFTEKQPRTGI